MTIKSASGLYVLEATVVPDKQAELEAQHTPDCSFFWSFIF